MSAFESSLDRAGIWQRNGWVVIFFANRVRLIGSAMEYCEMIARTTQVSTIGAFSFSFVLSGCSLPLVSEREVAIQAEEEFEKMRAEMPISNDIEVRRYIFCVANAIVATLEPPYSELDWDIEVFDDDMINAFAMPGGKIGVFTGILTAAQNQDQLGAVLGHEVAHVTEQHSVERANRTLTTQGLATRWRGQCGTWRWCRR